MTQYNCGKEEIEGVGTLSPFLTDFLESDEDIKLILSHVIDSDGRLRVRHPDVQNALMDVIREPLVKRLRDRYVDEEETKAVKKASK